MTMGTAAYETYALEDLVVQPSNKMQRLSEDTSVNNLTILNMSDGTVYDTILLVNCVLTPWPETLPTMERFESTPAI